MPPPANQGSRATLVTWTVVTAILFVTATVFAIYFYVDASKVDQLAKTNAAKYADYVDDGELGSPTADITGLKTARQGSDNPQITGINPSMKLLDVALAQRNALATKITTGASVAGSTDPDKSVAAANAAITQAVTAVKGVGGTAAPTSLVDAIGALSTALASQHAENASLKASVDAANDALTKKVAETTAQLDAMNKTIDGIRAEQQKAVGDVTDVGNTKDDQIKQLQGQIDQAAKDAETQQTSLQQKVTDAQRKADQLQKQLDVLRDRLGQIRVDPTKPILAASDGHVVRVPGGSTCFIDLGYGDHISPGLTFEVYDKYTGVPPVGDPNTDDNLPAGKASLEVTHVGATSSECRITHTTPGTAISEGDLIANLVYDKNTKYNFVVFGNFDLARTGKTQPQDAEVIKRLITQWGGSVVNKIDVNTDFVILGAEPEIPDFTKDELNDPLNKAKYDQAVADAAAYDDIKGQAKDLRIPILNQNRFLYFVGYYDQAQR
jgi:hypothetical protein